MLRALAITSLAALLSLSAATSARPAIVPLAQGKALRTVLVVPKGSEFAPRTVGRRDCIAYPRDCVNGVGGIDVAYAISGTPPTRTQLGTVLTDTNCQPDSYGVSHCTNRIRLANGRELTVRHDHSMMNDPCLSPGERVHLRVAAQA
jgi:hypothetical protein